MLTAVEKALMERLQTGLGTRVRHVGSLPSEWTEDLMAQLLRVVPAIYVAFAGGRSGGTTVGVTLDTRWVVYVVTGHAGGADQRRKGDGREPGAYALLQRVMALLQSWSCAEGTFSLEQVDALATSRSETQGVLLYGTVWRCPMLLALEDLEAEGESPLEGIDLTYDLVPADASLEARDTLEFDS